MKATEIIKELILFAEDKSRIAYMNGMKKSSYDYLLARLKVLRKICREQERAIVEVQKELDKHL